MASRRSRDAQAELMDELTSELRKLTRRCKTEQDYRRLFERLGEVYDQVSTCCCT